MEELKGKANTAFSAGKNDEAIDLYTQAIALDDKNHVLFSNRSAAYAKSNKFEEALKDAEKCLSLKPDFVKVDLSGKSDGRFHQINVFRVILEKVLPCRFSNDMMTPLRFTKKA